MCGLMDLASMMRIGVGKLLDGLYFLKMGEPIHVNVVTGKES
ncbi:hypothetical protein KSS87_005567, partial [Heliosperma pusillum]